MARQELEKVVAAQALEAAKEVLQHLQNWAVQLEEKGERKPRELSQLYGQVRRIRDYLNRSIGAHMHPVELDLNEEDCNTLASCCVFSLQGIGMTLRFTRDLASNERAWLEEKRDNLTKLVITLATEEIKVIPAPGGPKPPVPMARLAMDQVRRKVLHGVKEEEGGTEQGKKPREQPSDGGNEPEPASKPQIQTGAWTGGWSGKRHPLADSPTAESLSAGGLDRRKGDRRAADRHDGDLDKLESGVREEEDERHGGLTLDSRLIRDPRLRTMLVLDVRALERARAAKDYRLSAVHLCSVCEAVVVDVALARRGALDLKGTPENWKLDDVIRDLLGEKFSTSDRASLYHLIACRNLIRPSIQLHNPIVVTQGTLTKMIDFVQHLLVELGVCGSGSELPTKGT
ncbi:MAG: hypothetical protein ACYTF5_15110 [Planctomycetota bacterium]|jgi:hypothetical protein